MAPRLRPRAQQSTGRPVAGVGYQRCIGLADNYRRTPHPWTPSPQTKVTIVGEKKRNLPLGISGRAIFGTQNLGPRPPPPYSIASLSADHRRLPADRQPPSVKGPLPSTCPAHRPIDPPTDCLASAISSASERRPFEPFLGRPPDRPNISSVGGAAGCRRSRDGPS